MSLLAVGLSYRTAPLALLERAALDDVRSRALESALVGCEHVAEAAVLSTCNRLEVYAEVDKFHGGVAEVGQELAAATGVQLAALTDHLYVHYEAAALAHLFTVTSGLDSMALGEQQILGQVRAMLRATQHAGSAGRVLEPTLQRALRVGKRVHTETDLDRAGHSLVEAGLELAGRRLGPLSDVDALVVGAGSMSGLAVATLARAGVRTVTVVNRTHARATRLAATVGGRALPVADLPRALAEAGLVISSTGAVGYVLDAQALATARQRHGADQVYVDLALPRDVEPAAGELAGLQVLDLEDLGRSLAAQGAGEQVAAARAMVAEEVRGYLGERRAAEVAPTVVALRRHARSVVDVELARLAGRLGDVDDRVRGELEQCVHRVVEKLLHTPTVRIKELAGEGDAQTYAQALRALFDLDPGRVEAVQAVPAGQDRVAAGPSADLMAGGPR